MPINQGQAPADFTTPVGQVRLLLGDTDPKNVDKLENKGEYIWYSDDELTALLSLHGGDARRVAVASLRMIAVSQAMLLRKFSSSQLSVDGTALAKTLLDAAAAIEKSIDADATTATADSFDIVSTGGTYPRELTADERYVYGDRFPTWIV